MTTLRQFTRELDALIGELERAPGVLIKTKATRAGGRGARVWGRKAERAQLGTSRTAEENAQIFEEQAAEGRDPLFADEKEAGQIVSKLETSIATSIETHPTGDTRRTLDVIGKLFVGWIKAHLRSERSERGQMAPIKESTRRYKERVYGAKPIMTRTGQLAGSLYHELKE